MRLRFAIEISLQAAPALPILVNPEVARCRMSNARRATGARTMKLSLEAAEGGLRTCFLTHLTPTRIRRIAYAFR